nr:MAG TPA: hypothetical protein [Caudoviricetes sp.]
MLFCHFANDSNPIENQFLHPRSLNENILFHQYNAIISFCQALKRIFSLLFLIS